MSKVRVRVAKADWDPSYGSYIVLLQEIGGVRYCAVHVTECETQIISVMQQLRCERPAFGRLTSALFDKMSFRVFHVELYQQFFGERLAKVIFGNRHQMRTIIQPAGEAIELAVRTDLPILVEESLLTNPVAEEQEYHDKLTVLQRKLETAVRSEDYERAATLRDAILRIRNKVEGGERHDD